jgi:predicted ester cyclase
MEGWLEKEGHTIKSWRRRWIVLNKDTNVLSYYKDEYKRSKCGEMFITRNTALSNLLDGHSAGKTNLFAILSTENRGHNYLLLSAPSSDEKTLWMQILQNMIDLQTRESDFFQLTETESSSYPKIEGWLEKEGQFIKSWKRRWMVFDPQQLTLSYFAEGDSSSKRGEFKLSNKSTVSPLKNGFSPGKANLFVLTSTFDRESILLSAADPEDRDRWISGIRQYLLKHQRRQTNFSRRLLSFPVTESEPCSVHDIRTIQMLYTDILTAPLTLTPDDDFSEAMKQTELFFDENFSEDYVEFNGSYDLRNKTSFLRQVESWWLSISDIRWTIQDLVVDRNKVAVWVVIRGTPSGSFFDLTVDGTVSFTILGLSVFTFFRGQIKCSYHLEDWGQAVQQVRDGIQNQIPTVDLLNLSPTSKLSPDRLYGGGGGDRVLSVSLRESSFDFLSQLITAPSERCVFFSPPLTNTSLSAVRELITSFYNLHSSSSGSTQSSETLSSLLTNDYVSYRNSSQAIPGRAFLLEVEYLRQSIPDLRWSIQDLIIDGNKAAVRLIVSGSPQGTFKTVSDLDGSVSFAMMALGVHVIANKQIRCSYQLEDWESALSQISRVRLSELSVSAAYSFCL